MLESPVKLGKMVLYVGSLVAYASVGGCGAAVAPEFLLAVN